MAKQLKFSDEARQSLLRGIEIVAKAVVTTMGPKGRNIALGKKWGAPNIVHDGVTVAKEIELEDPFENMGAQLVIEAADKTNDSAGDGTTTSTLLAKEISANGMKAVTAGANPMIVKKGVETAVEMVIGELKKQAKPIKNTDEITQVATVSAGDTKIGAKIAEALEKVGKNGIVTVEEGQGLTIEIDIKEGMEFDKGYISPYFVTNPEKMESEITDARILLTDKKISTVEDIVPFLEKFVKASKNLVIMADDVEGQALATLVVNSMRGSFKVLAIKAPGFGDSKKEMLEDIAILTGGVVISEDAGRTLESVEVEDLGQAEKVWANKESTRIIGGKGSKSALEARVAMINKQISESDSSFDKEKLEQRLAKLIGGVAQINVGATTEVELKEKKERVIDAVGATKAAIEEGIIPGGGIALLRARKALKNIKTGTDDEQIGVDIVEKALEQPIRWLAKNAGDDDGYVLRKVEESKVLDFGYNALTGEFGSMTKFGLLDPLKVTRLALQNAASVAMMVLTTEGLVVDIPEEEKTPVNMGGMPGM